MLDAYIYDGLRSPFGRHAGALATVRPDDLIATVMKNLIEKHQLPNDIFDEVLIGNTNQAGEDSRNIARNAALLAGLDVKTPGQTVNRLCASGLSTIIDAARSITCNEGDIFLAGGVESMTRAPFVFAKTETPFSREFKVFDTTIGSRFPNPIIEKQFGSDSMPQTGDNVARKYGITREEADKFAAASQAKYQAAKQAGFFDEEITPIMVSQGKKLPEKAILDDEHPRASSTVEAIKLALKRADLTLDDMSIIEINEAFASQVLGCLKGLDIDFDDKRVNPNGGAIAVGHPLGASGARLALSTARELQRTGEKYAVVSLCIGIGQGLAMVIERV